MNSGSDISEDARKALLDELVHLGSPPSVMAPKIRALPWDAHEPLVMVTCGDVAHVLTLFRDGLLPEDELHLWGSLVEVREDLDDDPRNPDLVKDLTMELAHPLLALPMSKERADELLRVLERDCEAR